ncbi:hypothetical protein C8Q79DRAFT_1005081 [Trametes meyenii]|nr:hypothetical protein C8Q79DRAFT_1005081 [Trametes meyenii]
MDGTACDFANSAPAVLAEVAHNMPSDSVPASATSEGSVTGECAAAAMHTSHGQVPLEAGVPHATPIASDAAIVPQVLDGIIMSQEVHLNTDTSVMSTIDSDASSSEEDEFIPRGNANPPSAARKKKGITIPKAPSSSTASPPSTPNDPSGVKSDTARAAKSGSAAAKTKVPRKGK